jgi:hypothetical protein
MKYFGSKNISAENEKQVAGGCATPCERLENKGKRVKKILENKFMGNGNQG